MQAGAAMLPVTLQERFMENNMARWTNHARRASASWWSRVCRWQVGMLTCWSAFLMVAVFFFFLIVLWMTGQSLEGAGTGISLMMFPSCCRQCPGA